MGTSGFYATTVISLCVLLTACKGTENDAEKYLEEGKALIGQGKIEEARVQLQSALQIQPKLADGYYQLALIDEKKQDWKGMYNHLTDALKFNLKHVDAHLKLGQYYFIGHQFDKASAEADTVMQLQPAHIGGFTLRASILLAQGKKTESLKEVGMALEKDPMYYDAVILQSSIYLAEHNYAEALATLNRNIDLKPRDIRLQLLKIRAETENNNPNAAIADYQVLISQYPDKQELVSGLVKLLLAIGRQEQAEGILRQFIDKNPDNVEVKLLLVDVLEPRDEAEAEKMLKQFVEAQPKMLSLLFKAADFYEARKRYADAQTMLKRIIELDKTGREGLSAKTKLARIALVQNDSATAESLIAEVLASDAENPEALLLRAGIRLNRRNTDAAIVDLRMVLSAQPDLASAQELLARAYTQRGDLELAASTRWHAFENKTTNIKAALPVVMLMLKEGRDLPKAELIIENALKANPDNRQGWEMLAQVRTAQKNWNGAQEAVAELGRLPGTSAVALFLSAEILSRQGKYADAIGKFQQALAEKPDFDQAINGIAEAYLLKGNRLQLIAYLKSFIETNPKVIEAYNQLGIAYAAEKSWADASKILQDALVIDPKSTSTYEALANVYKAQNKPSDAVDVYRKGLAAQPDSFPLRMYLAQHYVTQNDVESAIALLNETVEKFPDNDLAVNRLSWLLATKRSDSESLKRASELANKFSASPNPHLLDTYAWISLLAGNKEKAISTLKQVIAIAPDNAQFQYHLGVAYNQASNKTAAKTALEKAVALGKKQHGFSDLQNAEKLIKELTNTADGTKAE